MIDQLVVIFSSTFLAQRGLSHMAEPNGLVQSVPPLPPPCGQSGQVGSSAGR